MPCELLEIAPVFLVRNLLESVEYFKDKIGFEARIFHFPPTFAILSRGSVRLMLAACPPGKEPPTPNWKVVGATNQAYIWVTGIEELYEELKSKGVSFDYQLYETPWGTREFGIQDLDEHDITFGQVIHP